MSARILIRTVPVLLALAAVLPACIEDLATVEESTVTFDVELSLNTVTQGKTLEMWVTVRGQDGFLIPRGAELIGEVFTPGFEIVSIEEVDVNAAERARAVYVLLGVEPGEHDITVVSEEGEISVNVTAQVRAGIIYAEPSLWLEVGQRGLIEVWLEDPEDGCRIPGGFDLISRDWIGGDPSIVTRVSDAVTDGNYEGCADVTGTAQEVEYEGVRPGRVSLFLTNGTNDFNDLSIAVLGDEPDARDFAGRTWSAVLTPDPDNQCIGTNEPIVIESFQAIHTDTEFYFDFPDGGRLDGTAEGSEWRFASPAPVPLNEVIQAEEFWEGEAEWERTGDPTVPPVIFFEGRFRIQFSERGVGQPICSILGTTAANGIPIV